MGIVWAVNLTNDDKSKAEQFGEIRHINLRYVYGDEIVDERVPDDVHDKLRLAAHDFDPATDYVLIVGDHLQLVQFVAALGNLYVSFRALRYDKKAEGYIPVRIQSY